MTDWIASAPTGGTMAVQGLYGRETLPYNATAVQIQAAFERVNSRRGAE